MTILCEPDPVAAANLAPALGGAASVAVVPDLTAAALALGTTTDETVVVIGHSAPMSEVVEFTRRLRAERPDVSVILQRPDDELSAAAMAGDAGVHAVVPAGDMQAMAEAHQRASAEPVHRDLDRDTPPLHGTEAPDAPAEAGRPGRVVTVFSPKGGSGKTTIATNLAVALRNAGHTVCLLDLDLEFGDVAISLRLTPVRTLADAPGAEALLRDDDGIAVLATPWQPGMDCILAPIEPGEAEKIPAEIVTPLLQALRRRYAYIVVDTPSQFSEHVLGALDASDQHVLVANPELPALKNLRLTIDMFDLLGYDRRLRSIIFNRADDASGLTADDVEESLNSPLAVRVPASRDVPASINRGVPIVSAKRNHPVSSAIRRFAVDHVIGPGASARSSARRARLFRRKVA